MRRRCAWPTASRRRAPRTFVHVDAHGQVRSPARYKRAAGGVLRRGGGDRRRRDAGVRRAARHARHRRRRRRWPPGSAGTCGGGACLHRRRCCSCTISSTRPRRCCARCCRLALPQARRRARRAEPRRHLQPARQLRGGARASARGDDAVRARQRQVADAAGGRVRRDHHAREPRSRRRGAAALRSEAGQGARGRLPAHAAWGAELYVCLAEGEHRLDPEQLHQCAIAGAQDHRRGGAARLVGVGALEARATPIRRGTS